MPQVPVPKTYEFVVTVTNIFHVLLPSPYLEDIILFDELILDEENTRTKSRAESEKGLSASFLIHTYIHRPFSLLPLMNWPVTNYLHSFTDIRHIGLKLSCSNLPLTVKNNLTVITATVTFVLEYVYTYHRVLL